MIDREHVFGLRNEVGRDVRDITRNRGTRDVQQATKREQDGLRARKGEEKKGEEEKDGKKRKTGGGSKKVEAKMRRRAPGVAENRGK